MSGDDFQSFNQVLDVSERLAHAHKDDVVDGFSGFLFHGKHLADYFGGCQVAGKTGETRRAEFAAIGTSDLRRDADGFSGRLPTVEAFGGGYKNGFHVTTVTETEEKLAGSVFGSLGFDVLQIVHVKLLGKLLADWGGQVGHLIDAIRPLLVDPFQDLFRTIGFTTGGDDILLDILFAKA